MTQSFNTPAKAPSYDIASANEVDSSIISGRDPNGNKRTIMVDYDGKVYITGIDFSNANITFPSNLTLSLPAGLATNTAQTDGTQKTKISDGNGNFVTVKLNGAVAGNTDTALVVTMSPNSLPISLATGTKVGIETGTLINLDPSSTVHLAQDATVTLNGISNLATKAIQTNGTQKTQISDSSGNAANILLSGQTLDTAKSSLVVAISPNGNTVKLDQSSTVVLAPNTAVNATITGLDTLATKANQTNGNQISQISDSVGTATADILLPNQTLNSTRNALVVAVSPNSTIGLNPNSQIKAIVTDGTTIGHVLPSTTPVTSTMTALVTAISPNGNEVRLVDGTASGDAAIIPPSTAITATKPSLAVSISPNGNTVKLDPSTTVKLDSSATVNLATGTTVSMDPTSFVKLDPTATVGLTPGTTVGLDSNASVGLTAGTTVGLTPGTTVGLAPNTYVSLASGATVTLTGIDNIATKLIQTNGTQKTQITDGNNSSTASILTSSNVLNTSQNALVVAISPNGNAINATLDSTQLTSLAKDSTLSALNSKITLGAATVNNSIPVNIASNQTVPVSVSGTVPVSISGTVPVSLASSGLATETTLSNVNNKIPALGQTTMPGSLPVVIASDQSKVKVYGGGTAGTVDTNVITIQGNASGIPVPVTGNISNPSVATNASAIPTSSTLIGGKDSGGTLKPLSVDTSGNLNVNALNASVSTDGLAVPTSSTLIGGKDSNGFLQPFSVDVNGKLNINSVNLSVSINALAIPTSSTLIGGKDSNGFLQPLSVDTSGKLNINAINPSVSTTGSAVPASSTLIGVKDVNGFMQPILFGSQPMATSLPVVIASNQSKIPITGSGTAGSADAGVVTIQGINNGYPVLVSINGTASVLASLDSTALSTIASESTLNKINNKMPVLGQTTMSGSLPVVIASDQSKIKIVGNGTAGSADINPITIQGIAGGVAVPISGSVTATLTSSGLATETTLSTLNGKIPTALGQTTMSGSLPVVIASNQSGVKIIGNGVAGAADAGVVTIQGIAGATAVPVSISGTIPVSLNLSGLATETTLSSLSGKIPALGQTTMSASLPVVIASNQSGVKIIGSGVAGTADSNVITIQGNASGIAVPVSISGTVPVSLNLSGLATETTLSSLSGKLPASVGQKVMTGSLPVVIASDQSKINVIGGGTAGTPDTNVITIQGNASGIAIPISGTVTATNPSIGIVSTPTAVPGSATLIGGKATNGNIVSLSVDNSGNLSTSNVSVGTNNSTAPTYSTLIGGYDGTNIRPLSVNTSGAMRLASLSSNASFGYARAVIAAGNVTSNTLVSSLTSGLSAPSNTATFSQGIISFVGGSVTFKTIDNTSAVTFTLMPGVVFPIMVTSLLSTLTDIFLFI